MIKYMVVDKDNNILRSGTCQPECLHTVAKDGETVVEGYCEEANKKLIDGIIVNKDDFVVSSDEEKNALLLERLREERNKMLLDCDWTLMPDCQLSDEKKQQWIEYRQKLRDLPSLNTTQTDYANIEFPEEPV